jgi:integral membrane sensor domain MASE1
MMSEIVVVDTVRMPVTGRAWIAGQFLKYLVMSWRFPTDLNVSEVIQYRQCCRKPQRASALTNRRFGLRGWPRIARANLLPSLRFSLLSLRKLFPRRVSFTSLNVCNPCGRSYLAPFVAIVRYTFGETLPSWNSQTTAARFVGNFDQPCMPTRSGTLAGKIQQWLQKFFYFRFVTTF